MRTLTLKAENAERRKLYKKVGGIRITGTRGGVASADDVKFNADGMRRIIAHVHCSPDGHPTRPVRRFLELHDLRYVSADAEHLEIIGPADKIALFVNPGFSPKWLIDWHYKTDIRYPGAFPARKGPKYSADDKAKLGAALASSSARSVTRFAPDHIKPDRKTLNNIRVERNAKLKAIDRAELESKLSDPVYVAGRLRQFIANNKQLLRIYKQFKKVVKDGETVNVPVMNSAYMKIGDKLFKNIELASRILGARYKNVPRPVKDVLPQLTPEELKNVKYSIMKDDPDLLYNNNDRIFAEFIEYHTELRNESPQYGGPLTGDGNSYVLSYGKTNIAFTDIKRAVRHAMKLPERINDCLVSWDIHCNGVCVFTGGSVTETE